ncbi:MAG: hypothetical protein KDK91_28920 [Gammaproteobacteria bacterium]|nr:hypothetical protein [Gammaproteobacteria bacterium]
MVGRRALEGRARWRARQRPARLLPRILSVIICMGCAPLRADQQMRCLHVSQPPAIDGVASESSWSRPKAVVTRDAVSAVDVELRCLYSSQAIFFLVSYADPDESREHKTMHWDPEQKRYRSGPEREDTFVFKWSMEPDPIDLSLAADHPYKADIWYWKALRTDPVGYADDKYQVYTNAPVGRATRLLSHSGRRFYLLRDGDDGEPAYEMLVHAEFERELMSRYTHRKPTLSRADVRAKGLWQDGRWTIELGRALRTAHHDDVQFEPGRRYQFGISRHEIAGRKSDATLRTPDFGAGEVGESLTLVFDH